MQNSKSSKNLAALLDIEPDFIRHITRQLVFFDIQQNKLSCKANDNGDSGRPNNDFCQGGKQSCRCGVKAQCFNSTASDTVEPIRVLLDKAVTAAYMSQFDLDPAMLMKLFEAFYVTGTRVLEVYASMNGLTYGKDVILIFKGGNVFRMMFESVLHELSADQMCSACKEWTELLGVSDLDFDVYLHKSTPERVREVTLIMAVVMDAARVSLQDAMSAWNPTSEHLAPVTEVLATTGMDMSTFKFETDSLQSDSVIAPLTSRDPSAASGADICATCNTLFMPVPHVLRQRSNGQLTWFRTMPGNGTPFPMSLNRTLGNLYKTVKVNANLLRIRRSVTIHLENCKKRCAAEVYDLTIAYPDDFKHQLIAASPGIDWFQKVTYKREDGSEGAMWTPSLWHFFEDLFITMFVTNTRPWLANRLEKRIGRWAWMAAMLSLVENLTVGQVEKQLRATAELINMKPHDGAHTSGISKALMRIVQSTRQLRAECSPDEMALVDKFDKDVITALDRTAATLSSASKDMKISLKRLQTEVSLSKRSP